MSVKSHLTYGAPVRPENAVTYSAGNEGQNICGVFSETAPLQRSSTPSIVRPCVQSAIFPAESGTHAHYSIYHVWWWTEAAISSQFLCRAEGGCEFPLVMPPSKVCPQCNAIRLKVCKSCQHSQITQHNPLFHRLHLTSLLFTPRVLHFSALVLYRTKHCCVQQNWMFLQLQYGGRLLICTNKSTTLELSIAACNRTGCLMPI